VFYDQTVCGEMAIFTTWSNLRVLCARDVLLMDGAFHGAIIIAPWSILILSSLYFAQLKPNSITLSGSNQLRASFEPASVMEFGFIHFSDMRTTPICR